MCNTTCVDSEKELLNVRETAKRLDVHENTVRNWVRQGLLKDSRVPGSRFHKFRIEDVDRLVAQRGEAAATLQTERRNLTPELVGASQIAQWPASRARDAQGIFPELFRRLIGETPGATIVSIPSGDGVSAPGFDGIVEVKDPTTYLPAGRIVVEMGVGADPAAKATEDYFKRAGEGREACVFLFATPLRWPRAQEWIAERSTEGRFADVRVIDADQLEGWLLQAPSTHYWLSEHLGLRPRDAVTLTTWWNRLSTSTDPLLPAGLCGAGRESEIHELRQLVAEDDPRLTSIHSEWHVDGIAFIHAALGTTQASDMPSPLIVENAETWERVVDQPGQAILIPQFDGADVDAALNAGHHVVAVIDATNQPRQVIDIRLQRLDRTEAREMFQSVGVDWPLADRLAVLGRRSLPALIRSRSRNPSVRRPEWATPEVAEVLAPVVLAGSWVSRPGDQDVLVRLTGRSWADLEPILGRASRGPDPLLRQIDGHWSLASPEEAFLVLGPSLTSSAAGRWQELVREVLLESDPFRDMDAAQRISAQMKGLEQTYSATLRSGLALGIAMIGAIQEGLESTAPVSPEVANSLVRQLLAAARSDRTGGNWAALSNVLPLLAEGAPEVFLDALDDDLADVKPTVGHLFEGSSDPLALGPTSRHSHLLWALEQLCWTEDYLVRASQVLAKLCRFTLPENAGNSPLNSLDSVLCGWTRNTDAEVAARLEAVDAVRRISSEVGWKLLLKLWPKSHATSFPPSRPRFRVVGTGPSRVLMSEWHTFVAQIVGRAIEWSTEDVAWLPKLVDRLSSLPEREQALVVGHLESAGTNLDNETRLALFNELQQMVSKHEEFATSSWAVTEEVRECLARLRDQLEPEDDMRRLAYLFDWHPVIPGFSQHDFESYREELHRQRMAALRDVLDLADPYPVLAEMARRAKAPQQLGGCLAELDVPMEQALDWLFNSDEAVTEAARSFIYMKMVWADGGELLAHLLHTNAFTIDQIHLLVPCIPPRHENWQVLAEYPDADDAYWTTANIDVVAPQDTREAITKLMDHGRPWRALAVAAFGLEQTKREEHEVKPLETTTLVTVVSTALQTSPGPGDIGDMTTYYLGKVLDYLEDRHHSEEELVSLEWGSYRLMEHYREPRALNRALANDPELFVELVTRAFRGKDEKPKTDSQADGWASHAMWVLHSWHGFPGRKDDGSLDGVRMREWVVRARLLLSDLDRTDIGDEVIGQSLASSPAGEGEIWPSEPVRDLIETIGSRELENGLIIGTLNNRGVTSRPVYAGGALERAEAERYRNWSTALQASAPRTARALRTIADSYEQDAKREDRRAEIDQDRD